MLAEYYRARGWDNQGVPARDKLEELELADL
jgi:aldehyde:ferredoxin oxidoreductase